MIRLSALARRHTSLPATLSALARQTKTSPSPPYRHGGQTPDVTPRSAAMTASFGGRLPAPPGIGSTHTSPRHLISCHQASRWSQCGQARLCTSAASKLGDGPAGMRRRGRGAALDRWHWLMSPSSAAMPGRGTALLLGSRVSKLQTRIAARRVAAGLRFGRPVIAMPRRGASAKSASLHRTAPVGSYSSWSRERPLPQGRGLACSKGRSRELSRRSRRFAHGFM